MHMKGACVNSDYCMVNVQNFMSSLIIDWWKPFEDWYEYKLVHTGGYLCIVFWWEASVWDGFHN